MSFNPKAEYTIVPTEISIKDFYDYKEDYVTRPPYQRKVVWNKKKKQALLDSLFRRYYVPKLVIREVRITNNQTVNEIVDGQQRISTVQDFFDNQVALPKSLADIDSKLPGLYYKDLDTDIRKFIDKSLKYQSDVIKDIDQPHDVAHQITATEIFWRLQQGESLNYMEVAHAQLSSLTRNFIVKYADDQAFDYENYEPVDVNKDKVNFFKIINVDNSRMKHLQLMARFILLEQSGGAAELSDRKIEDLINDFRRDNGIANLEFENTSVANRTLNTLRFIYDVFKDDYMHDEKSGIRELSVEYFIISVYLLMRHIHNLYAIDDEARTILRQFVYDFHARWKSYDENVDTDMLTFSNRRQQGEKDVETRDLILRHMLFEYLHEKQYSLIEKDPRRAFSENERISIYRSGKGFCQQCLRDGVPENEARISWSKFQADHIVPHSKGGWTELINSELLCAHHNGQKSDK